SAAPGPPSASPAPTPASAAPRRMTKQEVEEGRAAVERAKAEAYRRMDQGSPSAPTAAPAVAPPVVATAPTSGEPPSQSITEILTNDSILSMVKVGLDETLILAKIAATPARFDTQTEALIALKQAGVSDRILAAMVGKPPTGLGAAQERSAAA